MALATRGRRGGHGGLIDLVAVAPGQHGAERCQQARDQRFVDTASQTVVNMYSYTQDTVDETVNRFVNGTSGPLRDMLSDQQRRKSQSHVPRHQGELGGRHQRRGSGREVDDIAENASVLVSVRVTVTDIDGVNKPSSHTGFG